MSEIFLNLQVATGDRMQDLGRALGLLCQEGDLIILTGDLGAGKTTFTQGLGDGLGVRGPITSPTFVIAREHPSLRGGPALVHVDAYRLSSLLELDALDLDTELERAVTVVEWGSGLVEVLSPQRLEIEIIRPRGAVEDAQNAQDGTRQVRIKSQGPRWNALESGLSKSMGHENAVQGKGVRPDPAETSGLGDPEAAGLASPQAEMPGRPQAVQEAQW